MNLYKVEGGIDRYWESRKIKAKTRQLAIIKFMELVDENYHDNISAIFICKMADIVEA